VHQQDRLAVGRTLLGMGDANRRSIVRGDGGVVRREVPAGQPFELAIGVRKTFMGMLSAQTLT